MSLFLIDDQEKDFCVFTLDVASFFPSMMCVKDSTPIHGLFISNVVVVESHLHTLFFFFSSSLIADAVFLFKKKNTDLGFTLSSLFFFSFSFLSIACVLFFFTSSSFMLGVLFFFSLFFFFFFGF